jgi:hypothetical protein
MRFSVKSTGWSMLWISSGKSHVRHCFEQQSNSLQAITQRQEVDIGSAKGGLVSSDKRVTL